MEKVVKNVKEWMEYLDENVIDVEIEDNRVEIVRPYKPLAPEWGNSYGYYLVIWDENGKYEVTIGRYTKAWRPKGWGLSMTDDRVDAQAVVDEEYTEIIVDKFFDFVERTERMNDEIEIDREYFDIVEYMREFEEEEDDDTH